VEMPHICKDKNSQIPGLCRYRRIIEEIVRQDAQLLEFLFGLLRLLTSPPLPQGTEVEVILTNI
jgi:hypothetical protein